MIKNGFIVTMDKSDRLLTDGAICIEGPEIIDIGKTRDLEKTYRADEVIDASNGVIMPGLVNSHVHLTSVLRRGVEDDLPLEQWLCSGPPTQLASKGELVAAFRLVLLEMVKAGITCYSAGAGMLRERYESGLRAFCAFLITDEIGDYKSVLQRIRENYSDRFQFGLGPSWVPAVPEDTLLEVKEVAERHNLKVHMHVAESRGEIQEIKRKYGVCDGSIEYLDRIGLLSPRLVAAHCVHVSPREIDLMRMRGVGVVHCPGSNAKLGDGIAPLADFLKAKITLGLGSDGPATNNCIDMFQEMKLACLFQRAASCDPTVVKAEDVLRMATIGGAKLLGIDNEIGSLEIGKKADIIIVNFEKPHLYPKTSIISHLVYSAKASDVDTTIVDGKVLMKNRKVKTMNEASVLKEAQKAYENISSRK
ncbi:MAG: amidohydrolase [Thermoproteota archaeon]|nr:amidohydrolase [Thermoproteota archaeon]